MLFQADQERAVAFLSDNLDQVASFGDTLQLVAKALGDGVLELGELRGDRAELGLRRGRQPGLLPLFCRLGASRGFCGGAGGLAPPASGGAGARGWRSWGQQL